MSSLQFVRYALSVLALSTITIAQEPTEETRCARAAYFPLNVCLKMVTPTITMSYQDTCDDKYTYRTTYDDNQCQGNILMNPINISGCANNECICNSDIQCDYAKFRININSTQNECSQDSYIETAYVLNECFTLQNLNLQYTCDVDNSSVEQKICNDNSTVQMYSMSLCNVQCIAADIPEISTTSATETSETESSKYETSKTEDFDTTEHCRHKTGKTSFDSFDISFYIDCIDETITVNITYRGNRNNWFGIVFTDEIPDNFMYGEALIYTIGKPNEHIAAVNQQMGIPSLYLYNLTSKNASGVIYNGGDKGERNWREISNRVEQDIINIVYQQDLNETLFNLTTNFIPIRWAFGAGEKYMLKYHKENRGIYRAGQTLQLGLSEVEDPSVKPTVGPSKYEENNTGIIIGSVIGAFFGFMICVGIIWSIVANTRDKQSGSGYGAVGGAADTDNDEDVEMLLEEQLI
eukprot:158313_1